jgi:hypothetical protein
MASILKTAFQNIVARAATVTGVSHSAVWNNQIDLLLTGEGYSFVTPAVFFEMLTTDRINFLTGITSSNVTYRLHILHQQLDAGDGTMEQNLDIFDIRDSVKVLFTSYNPNTDYCSPLIFSGEEQDYNHNNVYHYIIDFEGSIVDTKGSPFDPDSEVWQEIDASDFALTLNIDAETPYLKK